MMPFQPGGDAPESGEPGPIVVSARFEAIEIDLLRLAATQLVDMLDAATTDPQSALTDPAFQRLLPDAYRDDPEAAAEFRRFTSDDLLAAKARNARSVLDTLNEAPGFDSPGFDSAGEELTDLDRTDLDLVHETEPEASVELDATETVAITLDAAAVQAWLRTLTDLRLTLAERLLIGPDGEIRLEGEEASFLGGLYDWLGMVQESLVYAIDV
ncbi:DUF2017 family protein [Cryobacterium melibiosiphilum]|uniref:DUF2017 family protein n=1 Tax=Cryobacterium melibiosiphilum TaxID=995039 RepID=A0A3A5MQ61_9MICO|nr:DUF2017 family protein [Cryobacterium melibiosiphilum]RJT88206.1 DUF2017 family protein [Cryobacterium melibiosiphilum]